MTKTVKKYPLVGIVCLKPNHKTLNWVFYLTNRQKFNPKNLVLRKIAKQE